MLWRACDRVGGVSLGVISRATAVRAAARRQRSQSRPPRVSNRRSKIPAEVTVVASSTVGGLILRVQRPAHLGHRAPPDLGVADHQARGVAGQHPGPGDAAQTQGTAQVYLAAVAGTGCSVQIDDLDVRSAKKCVVVQIGQEGEQGLGLGGDHPGRADGSPGAPGLFVRSSSRMPAGGGEWPNRVRPGRHRASMRSAWSACTCMFSSLPITSRIRPSVPITNVARLFGRQKAALDLVGAGHRPVGIGQQRIVEGMLGGELLLPVDRIGADADALGPELLELRLEVAEVAALRGASRVSSRPGRRRAPQTLR